jgi:hypothetical protein
MTALTYRPHGYSTFDIDWVSALELDSSVASRLIEEIVEIRAEEEQAYKRTR